MDKLFLEDCWTIVGGTVFLDATCYLFDNRGNFVELVDYAAQQDKSGAIIHSGDVLDYEKSSGKHTISITLSKLPPNIASLYFSLSTCRTTLKNIKQPFVRFTDTKTDYELCRYNLENNNTKDYTAVVMCKLFKSKDNWTVEALGSLGYGRCTQRYAPIVEDIKKLKL